ncbi:DUF2062 domain-containing protein [Maridesulfovibrio hydrothermalis]|uniref:DUF2062 domain-containing protein n=1 Tax=Maridesulfovibrio hydrothermalis AM13 = DSM 14728 TaxID=1121451 RepID=L0RCD2_9BACT|nr:DUF2062 domain-containing protein [Maridesulfovibrio hydrothermalis]CCO24399.1 conserved membrane protein of unknown function [Maridesulfovibrio hydrothermalis AM13 = DSM 14728]
MQKEFSRIEKLKRLVRLYYLKVMRINASPHFIAMGVACGVFGGCFPFIPGLPLQTAIAVAAAFCTRSSKIAAAIATWISNPLNWLLFYYIQFKIGSFLLPMDVQFDPAKWAVTDFMEIGWQGVTILIFGGFILGIPLAAISYFFALHFVRRYRKRKALRMLSRRTKL